MRSSRNTTGYQQMETQHNSLIQSISSPNLKYNS